VLVGLMPRLASRTVLIRVPKAEVTGNMRGPRSIRS